MTLNEWAKEIHENAVEHGWWDEPRTFGEIVALCHAELSEAIEEYRDSKPMLYCGEKGKDFCNGTEIHGKPCGGMTCEECYRIREEDGNVTHKPEGIATEMLDCVIRILDWCGQEGIDVDEIMRIKHEYNKTRPYRHGGKKI